MVKVAIFTEGQSELIFTRDLLLKLIFNYQHISIVCLELHNSNLHSVPYDIKTCDPLFHFQIIDVGTDNKVASYIGERFQDLISKNFILIIGLRDLYSEEYSNVTTYIDNKIINSFIKKQRNALNKITQNSKKVKLLFAIMEFEAWILSMPNLFQKINPKLSVGYIQKELGLNLYQANPQKDFCHPSNQVKYIYKLIGENYKKSSSQIENIMAKMDSNDISDALSDNKCPSFQDYLSELSSFYNPLSPKTT